jgi:hypothetical protein
VVKEESTGKRPDAVVRGTRIFWRDWVEVLRNEERCGVFGVGKGKELGKLNPIYGPRCVAESVDGKVTLLHL